MPLKQTIDFLNKTILKLSSIEGQMKVKWIGEESLGKVTWKSIWSQAASFFSSIFFLFKLSKKKTYVHICNFEIKHES